MRFLTGLFMAQIPYPLQQTFSGVFSMGRIILFLCCILAVFSLNNRRQLFSGFSRVRFFTHLYFRKRSMTQGILPTSSRQVQA